MLEARRTARTDRRPYFRPQKAFMLRLFLPIRFTEE
jgi:hypothetical protein